MSCQPHLHISPQSIVLQELPHSGRLERSHLVGGLQGELHHLDEVLPGGADGRLLVAHEVFIVLLEPSGRQSGGLGPAAAAERADPHRQGICRKLSGVSILEMT